MKTIKEHIRMNQLKRIYLLYGKERTLMLQYRDYLKKAICPEDDGMNVTRFAGKSISVQDVIDLAATLPFFADHRLLIIEDSKWFSSANSFADHIREFPDTTYFIFLEEAADKRTKLYKAVAELGYISEFTVPSEDELIIKIVGDCKKAGKRITKDAVNYIIENAGASYGFVCMELEKLMNYMEGKDAITLTDVQEICTYQAEDKIFAMIDAIGNMNQKRAVELYHDLVYLRKPVQQIMYNLIRMVNNLLQICEMQRLNIRTSEMARQLGLSEGVVRKYMGQLKNYNYDRLCQMLDACQGMETAIRSGNYAETVGLELLIVDFTTPQAQRT